MTAGTGKAGSVDDRDIPVSMVCLGCLLLLVPLVPFNFLYFDVLPPYLSAVLRFFPLAVVVIMAVPLGRRDVWRKLRREGFLLPHVFLLASGLALVLSAFSSVSVRGALARAIYYTLTGEGLCVITWASVRSRPAINRLLVSLMVAGTLVSLYGVTEAAYGQSWLSEHVFSSENHLLNRFSGASFELSERAISTIGNPNALGTFLSFCSPFFLLFLIRWQSRLRRICVLVAYFALVVLLGYTQSRGALVAFLTGATLFLWPKHRKHAWALVVTVVIGVCLTWGWSWLEKTYLELLGDYRNYHRPLSVMIATQIWSDHPWWGVGPGGYRHFSKPHSSQLHTPDNMYLMVLAENGIIGLGMKLGFLISYTVLLARYGNNPRTGQREGRQETGDEDLLRAVFASSIGFSLNMLTWDALLFPSTRMIFWMVAGLGLSLLRLNVPIRSGTIPKVAPG